MAIPAPTELFLIFGIVLLAFGGNRIPEIMGGLGQGIKVLNKSLERDHEPALSRKHYQLKFVPKRLNLSNLKT